MLRRLVPSRSGQSKEQEYVLTSGPGPRIRIVVETPGPHPAPPAASSSQPGTPAQTSPVTPSPDATGRPTPAIAWVDDGRYLAVITYGRGSCPDGPRGIHVVADQEIEVRLGALFPGRHVCTADLGPYVTVVELPEGITSARSLTARFGKREATLPPVGR